MIQKCQLYPLLSLALLLLFSFVTAKRYYITSKAKNDSCPTKNVSCITISEFASKPQAHLSDSNITLKLLPGHHILESDITISNVTNFTMVSTSLQGVRIICADWVVLSFSFIDNVHIGGIEFKECMENSVGNVHQFVLEHCTFSNRNPERFVITLLIDIVTSASVLNTSFFLTADTNVSSSLGGITMLINYSNVSLTNSTVNGNMANRRGAVQVQYSTVLIRGSTFINNVAGGRGGRGGAVNIQYSRVTLNNCTFANNTASIDGGSVHIKGSVVELENNVFINNRARFYGGAVSSTLNSNATIRNSVFMSNEVNSSGVAGGITVYGGGAVFLDSVLSKVTIENCTFHGNTVYQGYGGALHTLLSDFTISGSTFLNNIADKKGGAMFISMCHTVLLYNSDFVYNKASTGAALSVENSNIFADGALNIRNNNGALGAVHFIHSSLGLSGHTIIANNIGSLFSYSSNITFIGHTEFVNNSASSITTYNASEEGGSVTSFQSNIYIVGDLSLLHNEANNGGAMLVTESQVYFDGNTKVDHNKAVIAGGGIYAHQSELIFNQNTIISRNIAEITGGGVYAVGSSIKLLGGSLHFIANIAFYGGGLYLEQNARLYIIKANYECFGPYSSLCVTNPDKWLKLNFSNNSANYGGAIYVADDKNSGTCATTLISSPMQSMTLARDRVTSTECFLQVSALYSMFQVFSSGINLMNIHFDNNTALESGGILFGGLLDRCKISPFAEIYKKYSNLSPSLMNTTSYLLNITNLEFIDKDIFSTFSSKPVRLCFCRDGQPDCSYQLPTLYVMKGCPFNVSLVAVDQVNNTVPHSTIRGSLSSGHGRLSEGQSSQPTNESCTDLQYNAFSPCDNETLLLYAEGPCNDTGISQQSMEVEFLPCNCSIGFEDQLDENQCICDCDSRLSPYITAGQCFSSNHSLLREGTVNFWVTNIEDGFVLYDSCPYDYCQTPAKAVYINLNTENGSDAQCLYNRSGWLCGSCQPLLSQSLGSSQCLSCSNYWLFLLVPFAVAGVLLVAFLLALNLTVTVGTINGLIFYANIVIANRAIFIPFENTNILTVFISWLNLDFGFVTCFYNGMDGYAKVWLQLVFPAYIIFLVAMIIIISDYSTRFSKLLSYTGSNPVATLATLILLSYSKLLRTIIAAMSFTYLRYPDGSHTTVWLYDANIPFLEGKHIPLFIVAVIILIVGLVYTFLLFFWQWLVRCPNRRTGLCWIGLNSFMEVYQSPYHEKYRYWTGLLLFARVVLYIVSALNPIISDTSVNLLSTICVVSMILFYKTKYKVYKKWPLADLENSFILNLLIFSSVTLYLRKTNGNQIAVAYTSTSIAFITFLGIVIYHAYHFMYKKYSPCKHSSISFKTVYNKLCDSCCYHRYSSSFHRLGDFDEDVYFLPTVESTVKKDDKELLSSDSDCSVTEIDGTPARNDNDDNIENAEIKKVDQTVEDGKPSISPDCNSVSTDVMELSSFVVKLDDD